MFPGLLREKNPTSAEVMKANIMSKVEEIEKEIKTNPREKAINTEKFNRMFANFWK